MNPLVRSALLALVSGTIVFIIYTKINGPVYNYYRQLRFDDGTYSKSAKISKAVYQYLQSISTTTLSTKKETVDWTAIILSSAIAIGVFVISYKPIKKGLQTHSP